MTHQQRPQLDHTGVLSDARFTGMMVGSSHSAEYPVILVVMAEVGATGAFVAFLSLMLTRCLRWSSPAFSLGNGVAEEPVFWYAVGHVRAQQGGPFPMQPLGYDSCPSTRMGTKGSFFSLLLLVLAQ